jgi:hypothetical protein
LPGFRPRLTIKQPSAWSRIVEADPGPITLNVGPPGPPPAGIEDLLELARAVLADGVVTEQEAVAIGEWFLSHPDLRDVWPAKALADPLHRILADGRVDEAEARELAALLKDVVARSPRRG